ncbi:hypothetical protein Unana1_07824 [Umbelopsis nana]
MKLNPEGAIVLAIHLASKPRSKLCDGILRLSSADIMRYFDTRMQTTQKDQKSFLSGLFTSASSFSPIMRTDDECFMNDEPKPCIESLATTTIDEPSIPKDVHTNSFIPSKERPSGTGLYDVSFPEQKVQNLPTQVREFWGNVSAGVLRAIGDNRRFFVPHNSDGSLNELEYYDERNSWWKRSRRSGKYEKYYSPRQSKSQFRTDDEDIAQSNATVTNRIHDTSSKIPDLFTAAFSHQTIDMRLFKTCFDKMSPTEPDETFTYLSNLIKISFQHWEGLGNSFLSPHDDEDRHQPHINQDALEELFTLLATPGNKNASILLKTASESLGMLLTCMILNCDDACQLQTTADDIDTMSEPNDYFDTRNAIQWCRSLVYCMQWYMKQKKTISTQSSAASTDSAIGDSQPDAQVDSTTDSHSKHLAHTQITVGEDVPMQRLITVLSKISSHKSSALRTMLLNMMQCFDAEAMSVFVKLCHAFLEDHYHASPYKLAEEDHVIRSAKALELLYDANCQNPTKPIVPLTTFYNDALSRILDVKDEYRSWKRVLLVGEGRHSASSIVKSIGAGKSNTYLNLNENQRRTRLFLTTTSTSMLLPVPLMHEYQFSIFSYPFLLAPPLKRKILHIDSMAQMSSEYEDACVNHTLVAHAQRLLSDSPKMVRDLETSLRSATCPYLLLEVRRESLVQDTWQQISRRWADLKKPLKVRFIAGGEEGMDQGGVQKEFFGVLMEQLIHSPSGLFDIDPETRTCWISSNAGSYNESTQSLEIDAETRRTFEMFGVMMGLAIYNGVILGLQFPKVFWRVLTCSNPSRLDDKDADLFTIDELEDGWPSLGKGLRQLQEWEQDDVEDIFCRSYEISYSTLGNVVVNIPLKADGDELAVTNDNRSEFVDDYCRHFMYTWVREPLLAIRRGVWSVIGGSAVAMCTADELEVVACGQRDGPDGMDLDMKELEAVADYDDGYDPNHPVIKHFWSIVHELSPQHKRQLLLFVTASDRIPVGGLKELMFVIQRNGPDSDRLPTALTCFCRLLLPEYSSREKLKNRLLVSIENAKGFGLV